MPVHSIRISQGTVATRFRRGGSFNKFYRKLSAECAIERIIKIGQKGGTFFMDHSVVRLLRTGEFRLILFEYV